ncbi:Crp/Fnr family transcriptional regulator [Streptomyces albidoflavus]
MKDAAVSVRSEFHELGGWPPGTFLSRLAPEMVEVVLGLGSCTSFRRGEALIHEGAQDTQVLLLQSGTAKVTSHLGRDLALLGIRVAGEVVGEMAASNGTARTATVTACSDIEATIISGADWNRLLDRHPVVLRAQQWTVSRRLQKANRWRAVASASEAKTKVALCLAELASDHGRPGWKGVVIDVALSQAELGSLVGLRERTVQKAIADLRDDGAVGETGLARFTIFEEPLRRVLERDSGLR